MGKPVQIRGFQSCLQVAAVDDAETRTALILHKGYI